MAIYICSVNFVFEYQIKNTVELCPFYLQLTTTVILEQLTKPAIRFIGIETKKGVYSEYILYHAEIIL